MDIFTFLCSSNDSELTFAIICVCVLFYLMFTYVEKAERSLIVFHSTV